MSDQNPTQEQWGPIFTKVMKDETFRQQLLRDPKGTLERETGKTFPPELTIQVHEDTSTTLHIVLPMRPQTSDVQELSDADLEAVAGGLPCSGHGSNSVNTWGGGACTPC